MPYSVNSGHQHIDNHCGHVTGVHSIYQQLFNDAEIGIKRTSFESFHGLIDVFYSRPNRKTKMNFKCFMLLFPV